VLQLPHPLPASGGGVGRVRHGRGKALAEILDVRQGRGAGGTRQQGGEQAVLENDAQLLEVAQRPLDVSHGRDLGHRHAVTSRARPPPCVHRLGVGDPRESGPPEEESSGCVPDTWKVVAMRESLGPGPRAPT
jgi:hypothetical protein